MGFLTGQSLQFLLSGLSLLFFLRDSLLFFLIFAMPFFQHQTQPFLFRRQTFLLLFSRDPLLLLRSAFCTCESKLRTSAPICTLFASGVSTPVASAKRPS